MSDCGFTAVPWVLLYVVSPAGCLNNIYLTPDNVRVQNYKDQLWKLIIPIDLGWVSVCVVLLLSKGVLY